MNYKTTLFGAIAYTLVTFPLAIIWHLVLFEDKYRTFGYFDGEPSILLGFLTILLQGLILSLLFPLFNLDDQGITKGIKYSLFIGLFFWSSHVLAFVAKQAIDNSLLFIFMESFYLLIQFTIYGILIGLIHDKVHANQLKSTSNNLHHFCN